MRSTIKNKTMLRREIKNSLGNTGSLDYIEFYKDFSWERMGCSSYSRNCIDRRGIASLSNYASYMTADLAITLNFMEIESKICASIPAN